jgi:multidrug efflux pump subunit AcrA (membrane-fusion protein)
LEFNQKLIHYVKEINLPLNRRCSCRYCFINYTFKNRVIGNKDEGKEVETAVVNAITIVETVSATKIQPEIEVKISSEVSGEIILLPVVEGQVVKKEIY